MIEQLPAEKWLELNASLQKKKNAVRKLLKEKGILPKKGRNTHSNYDYFSEAQYKELFTELLGDNNLEITFSVLDCESYVGEGKMVNGRVAKCMFTLTDCETGFNEVSVVVGDAMDNGDKAVYKAYTGALKYFLANTFAVATGDDPNTDTIEAKGTFNKKTVAKPQSSKPITTGQINMLMRMYDEPTIQRILYDNGVTNIDQLSMQVASDIIGRKIVY